MRFAIFLCALLALVVPSVQAATTCTASLTNINFGTIDPRLGATTSGTLTYSCQTTALALLGSAAVRLCFSIGDGTNATFSPRVLKNPSNDLLSFDLYTDPAISIVWGTLARPTYPPYEDILSYAVPVLVGGSRSSTKTVYAKVFANQGWLGAGTYTNAFSGINTRLSYRYNEAIIGTATAPASCQSGGAGGADVTTAFPFTASATVAPNCAIQPLAALDFGSTPGLMSAATEQTSTIGITCTNRAPWKIGLGNGNNSLGNERRMRLSGTSHYLGYELYRDSARTLRWGNDLAGGTDTHNGTGSGALQNLILYGRVPVQGPITAGAYSDTIILTVTY